MRKYKVICHMLMSLDGKADGNYLNYSETDFYSNVFEEIHDKYETNAWICGRVTFEEHFIEKKEINLEKYIGKVIDRKDFIAYKKADEYAIAIDSSGKLSWTDGIIPFEDDEKKKRHYITVLSEEVSDEYLAYLQDIKISYVFAGKTRQLDLKIALDKINQYFDIDKFLLEGGGYINGSFLSSGLVDELSLIMVPVVEGTSSAVSIFEYGNNTSQPLVDFKLKKLEKLNNDCLWLVYETNKK